MKPKFIIINVGCLECEVWTYIHAVTETKEQAIYELKMLTGQKVIQLYTPTNTDFDRYSTCIAYARHSDGQRIAEIHRLPH